MSTAQAAAPAPAEQFLTPDEIAAMNYREEDDPNAGDADAQAAALRLADETAGLPAVDPAAVAVAADGEPAADPAADPAVADPKADPAAPVAAKADEPPAAPAPEPAAVAPAPSAPLLVIQAPADAAEQLEKIATDKDALAEKFDAGDLTATEFNKQLDALNKSERAIETLVNNADLAAKMEVQRRQNEWDGQCATFFSANKQYDDPALFAQFNDTVKAIAVMPRNSKLSGDQVLAKAHLLLQAELGNPVTPPVVTAPKAEVKPPAPQPQLPPNVGALPAADVTDATGGRWDGLNRLAMSGDVEAYEAALGKLSAADHEAYMRA